MKHSHGAIRWTRFAVALFIAVPLFAQGYLSPLESNKKVVFDYYRLVVEPRNGDLIGQFVADDFIDHDQDKKGTSAVANALKAMGPAANDDLSSTLQHPPALIMAQADLVTYLFKNGDNLTLEIYRVKDHKIVEHWKGAAKQP
jgi:predicted SnoaL-like aldol condensation-catalyzing enzyme